jgi:nucleoside-diphosphate-sugar epimerase
VSAHASAPIVVTGGAGFVGRALCARLAAAGASVTAVTRRPETLAAGVGVRAVGDITAATEWAPLLAGARAVVHLASRAHAPAAGDALGWIEGEAAAARALAQAAGRAGVERLIFLSSVKVLGERTDGAAFRADRHPAPEDVYGLAKWRIEEAMRAITASGGPALTIIRPPLVYGPGVKANFRALLRLVDSGLPLPFAGIANRRSLVFLDNLIDLLEIALDHPAARGGTFLLRDAEEVSTPELIRRIAEALGRPARLVSCPPTLLRLTARMLGRAEAADRLLDSLRIDDTATRARLGWRPRVTLEDGLAATARWYREARVPR